MVNDALRRLQADMLRGLKLLTKEDMDGLGTLCQWLATCSLEDLQWLEEDYARQVALLQAQLAAVREEIAGRASEQATSLTG